MNKKYYWLKLKVDFFSQKEIKKLRRIAGGDVFTIIYLKLQLLSLKNDGKLFFDGIEDTFSEELALELDENIEDVKITLLYLQKNNLLEEVSQDEYFLTMSKEFVGRENTSNERVRRHRERKKLNECNVTCNSIETKCNTEIEIEKEKEIEIEKEINILSEDKSSDRVNYQEIIKTYNNICTTLHNVRELNQKRKTRLRIMWKENPNLEYFKNIFNTVNNSDFLSGRNNVWANCNFDWIIAPSNVTKILEGQYNNKDKHTQQFDFSKCK